MNTPRLHFSALTLLLTSWLLTQGLTSFLSVAQAQVPVTEKPVTVTASVGTPLAAPPASDSLRLTLAQAEDQFLQRNINLLTAQLGISESQAQQIQSQLRPNPTIYAEFMPYNNGTAGTEGQKRFLPIGQDNSEQLCRYNNCC